MKDLEGVDDVGKGCDTERRTLLCVRPLEVGKRHPSLRDTHLRGESALFDHLSGVMWCDVVVKWHTCSRSTKCRDKLNTTRLALFLPPCFSISLWMG
jgi:hypothetical protein